MTTATTETLLKMLESLSDDLQERTLEHLREYIEDLREEAKWDHSFATTQEGLGVAARQARKEISEGKAAPLNWDMP